MVERMESEEAYLGRLSLGRIQYFPETDKIPKNLAVRLALMPDVEGFDEWLERVLSSENNLFSLGLMLTSVRLERLPGVREYLNPHETDAQIILAPKEDRWSLCDEAELYMNKAIETNQYTNICDQEKPLLVSKQVNLMAAICVESFTTSSGRAFVKGNWYRPFDLSTCIALREQKRINQSGARQPSSIQLQDGKWVLMRGVNRSGLTQATSEALGLN